jgi:hypothetical protein
VPPHNATTNIAGLNPTTRLLTALKAATKKPEVDYTHVLTLYFLPKEGTWFQPGVLGVAMLGEHPSPTLLMFLAACDATHYVAVLQHVGCYIGMLSVADIAPSMALSLKRPSLKALRDKVGFLAPKKTGKTIKVAKIGICPPALADEIIDSHEYPN